MDEHKTLRTVLIFLGTLAVILGIFAYFAVFGNPSGTYTITPMGGNSDTSTTGPTFAVSTSSASSTLGGIGLGSSTSPTAGLSTTTFASSYSVPPVSWTAGQSNVAVTGASLSGNQLTLTFTVALGASPECVPLDLRLVADEEGDLNPPNPAAFSFPDSGNCNGAANETYTNQTTSFIVDPTAFPLLFNAQDAAKTFFEISTTTTNGIQIQLPGSSD